MCTLCRCSGGKNGTLPLFFNCGVVVNVMMTALVVVPIYIACF